MKKVMELIGLLALAEGVLGLVHALAHWRVGFLRRLGFLDGYELYASVTLLVLGLALCAAAERRRSG